LCTRGGAGWGAHLRPVEDVVFEDVFEKIFAGDGVPSMHPSWTGAWGVTLEKMGRGGDFCVGPQVSGMCVSTCMGRKGERDTQWMGRESMRVRETVMGGWDQMLREFEGRRHGVEGVDGGDIWEGENKGADERDRLYTSLTCKSSSAEKRGMGCGDHEPLSSSVPP